MDDASFLGYFWQLGNGDPNVRRTAITGILSSLRATNASQTRIEQSSVEVLINSGDLKKPEDSVSGNEFKQTKREEWRVKDYLFKLPKSESSYNPAFLDALEYTTNRLVHGLSSGREAVRQGYSAVLTAILLEFPKAVPFSSIADAIHATTAISKKIVLGDQKDLYLGRIFGYLVLQQAGYFRSKGCLSHIETIVQDLLEALDRKAYLQDAVASALAAIIIDIDSHSPAIAIKFILPRLSSLFDSSVAQRLKTDTSELQKGNNKTEKAKGVAAPYGLLSLYLKLHEHLFQLLSPPSNPEGALKPQVAVTVDKKHQSWAPLLKDPLEKLDMRDITLLILSHQSTIVSLHPKIANGWIDLFSILVHRPNRTNRKQLFEALVDNINSTLFLNPKSAELSTLQRIFYGFRVMVQLLATLKVESLRPNPTEDLEGLLALYWTHSTEFSRQLLFHCHSCPPTPLQQAAMKCFHFLSQLIHGIPLPRLSVFSSKLPNKKDKSKELDIVSAGICSSVNLSSIDINRKLDSVPTSTQLGALELFYISPIAVNEDVWIRGAKAFGEASKFATLQSSALVRFADLFFRSLSNKGRLLALERLSESSFTGEGENVPEKYVWNYDLASQLIFFSHAPSVSLSKPFSLTAAASTVLQALLTALVEFKTNSKKELPKVIGLPLLHPSSKPIPFLAGNERTAPIGIKKRMISRLGPSISQFLTIHAHPIAKLILELPTLSNTKSKGATEAVTAKLFGQLDAISQKLTSITAEFFQPLILGLSEVLLPTENVEVTNMDQILFFFNDLNDDQNKTEELPVNIRNYSAITMDGKIIPIQFQKLHQLSQIQVKTCVMFGSLSSRLISQLAELLSGYTKRSIDAKATQELVLVLEITMSILCFSALLFIPLIAGRSPARIRTEKPLIDNEGSGSSKRDQEMSGEDWEAEDEADCHAALDLMKQLGTSCYNEIINALGGITKTSYIDIKHMEVEKILEVIADVIPSIVLLPLTLPSSPHLSLSKQDGINEIGRLVAQGISSPVFLSLWRIICRHASSETVDFLIKDALDLSDEEMNFETNGREEKNDSEGSEEEEESDVDKGNDDELSKDPLYKKALKEEKMEKCTDIATVTDEDMTAGRDQSEKDQIENEDADDDADEDSDEDGDEDDIEEVDSSKIFKFLLDDNAITPEDDIRDDGDYVEDDKPTNPFDREAKQKQVARKKHFRRVKVQAKFRAFDLIQSTLEGKLSFIVSALASSHLGVRNVNNNNSIIKLLLQQLKWIVKLNDGLRSLVNRISRKLQRSQDKSGIKKHEMLKIHSDLFKKLQIIVSQQCNKLMATLTKPKLFTTLEVPSQATLGNYLTVLRDLTFFSVNGFTQHSHSSLGSLVVQNSKCQELGSLLLLCMGRLEEQLLLVVAYNKDIQSFLELHNSEVVLTLPNNRSSISSSPCGDFKETMQNIKNIDMDSNTVVIKSSGLIFADAVTLLIFAWTNKKHSQLCERFFRCLIAHCGRLLSNDIPLALLGTPFAAAAIEASKAFVCRELLCVDSELRALVSKSTKTMSIEGLTNSPLGGLLANQLLKWNVKLLNLLQTVQHFIQDSDVIRIAVEDICNTSSFNRPLFSMYGSLLGWVCATQALQALIKNRTLMVSEISRVNGIQESDNEGDNEDSDFSMERNDKLSDSKAMAARALEESSRKNLCLAKPIPLSCQNLHTLQRASKLAFEQQVVLSARCYSKVIERLVEQSELNPSANLLQAITSHLETAKEIESAYRPHKRKRRRKEAS